MDTCLSLRLGNTWTTSWPAPSLARRCSRIQISRRLNNSLGLTYAYPAINLKRFPLAVSERASTSTYDAELQSLLLAGPPADFDFRAEITEFSRQWVDDRAPQLCDLVTNGTLVVVPRRLDYRERRTDGYCEPHVILLVGTAHVSRRSQQDVDRVIRAVVPDSVVVELCKSRSAALASTRDPAVVTLSPSGAAPSLDPDGASSGAAASTGIEFPTTTAASGSISGSDSSFEPRCHGDGVSWQDDVTVSSASSSSSSSSSGIAQQVYINPMNLAGASGRDGDTPGMSFLRAVGRSVSLGGQSALLLRVLLGGLASRTAGSLGVAGGGEFAAARAAAEEVGSQVVLGDRPVEITLSRAWAALPLSRRLKLCGELLRGARGARRVLSEELVERFKSDDAVSAFFNQLSISYPELVGPLVTERDMYLAWSLKRSKAVNGAKVVVGVVGRGHLRGVVYTLLRDEGGAGLRFSDLVEGRNSRMRRREQAKQGLQRLVAEVALGAAAYYTWLAFKQ